MIGIILVTQPPFLFPSGLQKLALLTTDLFHDFISPQLLQKAADTFDFKLKGKFRFLWNYLENTFYI